MKFLELKIPPVLQALFFIFSSYSISRIMPATNELELIRFLLSSFLVLIGTIIGISGVLCFKKNQTTVDPRDPSKTSLLVINGIYRYTRNPMYVGLFLALLAYAIYLGSFMALVFCLMFVYTMNELQIKPEERELLKLFGKQYSIYCNNTPRWIV